MKETQKENHPEGSFSRDVNSVCQIAFVILPASKNRPMPMKML